MLVDVHGNIVVDEDKLRKLLKEGDFYSINKSSKENSVTFIIKSKNHIESLINLLSHIDKIFTNLYKFEVIFTYDDYIYGYGTVLHFVKNKENIHYILYPYITLDRLKKYYYHSKIIVYTGKRKEVDYSDIKPVTPEDIPKKGRAIPTIYGIPPLIADAIINYVTWSDNIAQMVNEARPYIKKALNVIKRIKELARATRNDKVLKYMEECVGAQNFEKLDEDDIYQNAVECIIYQITSKPE
ncbi:hypothetical protein [Stygiolobus caldivivus]|uniref:Uncharacterized protein n=1 Tax=Stygiolobus caldivivus TaxID=2824673 RepID=A0A8D5ZGN8_9CREN|nr:hypothetical protein [Stygiolobus caldivivus]BCU71113.1 hypothetical protein KN1_24100 [Stygiolobus caldivivus]